MAIHLLHRAAAEAAFLLPQRGWTVGHLSEFYPPTANLLGINVNRGAAIRVRLRSPTAPSSFLDYDSVLSTLLHEFAHIAVGPHDVRFYTVLGELKAAVEGARIRAAGMASVGVYLPTEGRPAEAAAAAAAKSRAAAAASGGGVRLGGRPRRVGAARAGGTGGLFRLCLPAEMAAAAALRRAADDVTCGTGGDAEVGTAAAAGGAGAPATRGATGGGAAAFGAPSTAGARGAIAASAAGGGRAGGGASKRPRTGTGTPAAAGGRVLGGGGAAAAAAGAAAAARAAGVASAGAATGLGTTAARGAGRAPRGGGGAGAASAVPPAAGQPTSGGAAASRPQSAKGKGPGGGARPLPGLRPPWLARPAGRSEPTAVSDAGSGGAPPRGAAHSIPPWARVRPGGPSGERPTATDARPIPAAGAEAGRAARPPARPAGPSQSTEVVVLDADDEPPTGGGDAAAAARPTGQGGRGGRAGGGGGAATVIVLDDSD